MKIFLHSGKVFIFMTFLCLPMRYSFSQSIQNDVFASAGDSYLTNDYIISWTLGESFVETYQSENIQITEGFHQPHIELLTILSTDPTSEYIYVYPNPTNGKCYIKLNKPKKDEFYFLTVTDMYGKTLINKEINLGIDNELDFRQFSAGTILLNVERKKDGSMYYFKILKLDY